jgi:type I restriction enzyme S subunit
MEEMKNVPEIRFGGFKDNWNKKELDDEVDFYSGLTYSPKDVQKESGTFVIRSSNVKNNQLVEADDVFVNPDIVNSLNVEQGDIAVVVRNGSRHLIGKHAQIKTKLDNTVIGAFMTGLRPKNNSDFVNALLNTQTFQKEIEKNLGATINQITTGPFKKMEFFFPEPNEQIVIGDFVKNLNVSIKNHQTQLKKLTNLKKAMLIKMFPQDGASLPEIRFKGFDGEWEEKSFSNIINLNSGRDYKHLEKGGIPVYGTGGYMLSVNEALSYDENAIGIGRKGTIDKPYILKAPFWTVDTLFYAIPIGNNDLDFINCLFQKTNWKQKDESTGVPSLSKVTINNTCVSIPKENEQKEIGSYFRTLDSLMENHKEQLKKLNQIKKACLSKLFISQD